MRKTFYITKSSEEHSDNEGHTVPDTDKFRQIQKLNELISDGWIIKDFSSEKCSSYFILEKPDRQ